MSWALRLSLAGVLLLAVVGLAAGPPPAAPRTAVASDQLDYLYFASHRPVLIRLHLRIGDRPYTAAWDDFMDKMFAWFDKDKSGFLDATETARIPPPPILSAHFQGAIGAAQANNKMPLTSVDTNKDGKVSRDEFRAFYRNGGIVSLRFNYNGAAAAAANRINDAIYRRLDRDGDGKLSREEMARLPELMANLDANEDELLASAEITPGEGGPSYGIVAPRRAMSVPVGPVSDDGLIPLPSGAARAALASKLLARYDRNKDGKLVRAEIGLEQAEFNQLDANRNGTLEGTEVAAFFDRPPDLMFRARVGKLGVVAGILSGIGLGRTALVPPRAETIVSKGSTGKTRVSRVDTDTLTFGLGDSRFSLQASEGMQNYFRGVRGFYLQQFDALADKKGYVDKAQEKGAQPFLFQMFAQADRDADDKLTRKELVGWLDLVQEGATAFVTIQVNDQGRGLFEVVDASTDGKLSLRELRGAWERVKGLTRDGKGLARTDLPRTLRISMGQGNTIPRPVPIFFGDQPPAKAQPAPSNIPMWFRKLDINNDGDVSPKEWLGTDEDFRKIDTDGDGLISAEEARQFEARQKKANATLGKK